jgi:uncharacterized protein (DUF1015 family)
MARVRPFSAWRYASDARDISSLAAPPYDVISPNQRAALIAENPLNVVELELPVGPLDPSVPGNRYETGAATWARWRDDGVLVRDAGPTLYVLEQRYELGGRPIRRRAFVVEVGLEPFDAGVVLPHERTLPKALGDRFELIKATGANLSQVFGLFDDEPGETDRIFDAITGTEPVATATDADGVESVLWASDDAGLAAQLTSTLAEKSIFIADGHHRYTTALAYRDLRRAQATAAGEAPHDPAHDFVMMALVNMDDPDLIVLPTHRVAEAAGEFDAKLVRDRLETRFELTDVADENAGSALEARTRPSFLVKLRGQDPAFVAELRPEVDLDREIALDRSEVWKHLDVAVLQELVLDPLFDIHPDRPATLDRLSFVKDAGEAMRNADSHDATFILRPTRLDQLRAVALAGETMPQKSTFFHPKLLSGLVFRSAE